MGIRPCTGCKSKGYAWNILVAQKKSRKDSVARYMNKIGSQRG